MYGISVQTADKVTFEVVVKPPLSTGVFPPTDQPANVWPALTSVPRPGSVIAVPPVVYDSEAVARSPVAPFFA